jgi:hypothetical protein
MGRNTVILIHGYADKGESFQAWKLTLQQRGYDVKVLGYTTLSNEVTIKDIAEGLERALSLPGGLEPDEPFDVIVHSTGMLVIRAWLLAYPLQRHRLKRLIGLAPATFGSPVAGKARSWMGALMRGNRQTGEDFLENGDRILDSLELGSRFIWDLAHQDLLSAQPLYGGENQTPYVFVFCGTSEYKGLKQLLRSPGFATDGTVRWTGCGLNTRKMVIDLTQKPSSNQLNIGKWNNISIASLVPIAGLTHADIIRNPSEELIEKVCAALQVSSQAAMVDWYKQFYDAKSTQSELDKIGHWQQFLIRAIDERGDAIPSYNIELLTNKNGRLQPIEALKLDNYQYSRDTSLHCLHFNIKALQDKQLDNLWLQITASSNTRLVNYYGFILENAKANKDNIDKSGTWQGKIDISQLINNSENLFVPLTTTLIELRLNREPSEQGIEVNHRVCWFLS